MSKIYIYKTGNKSISYDEVGWYKNDVVQPLDGHMGNQNLDYFKSIATQSAFEALSSDICRYTSHFKNIAVLTAAGTSMENGKNSGKTRSGLWDSYNEEIKKITEVLSASSKELKDKCESIVNSKNIEDFLSLTILFEKLNGSILDDKNNSIRSKLEKKIADACRLTLDENNLHHQGFIRKLTARKPSDPRVQLYTTNYDTLFEQAAMRMNFTIIDGFSFTYPREFNGSNFNYDIVYRERTRIKQENSFISNVIQLYKMHGSVDWEKGDKGKIYQRENVENPCVIYPASEKYESSYEQPYFEMMAHFQQTLRKEGTLLIVTGFGFQDKHIQNVIKEAVMQNPNFHLIITCYGEKEIEEAGVKKWVESGITDDLVPGYLDTNSKVIPNVSIIFTKFKAFVDNYPENSSYNPSNDSYNEAIRP